MVLCEECEEKVAVSYCPDCYIMICPDCIQELHQYQKRKKLHLANLVPIEKHLEKKVKEAKRRHSYYNLEVCPHHGHPLNMYCRSCDELICDNCPTSTKHVGHFVVTKEKINSEIKV
jgi:hypothetical protein